MDTYSTLPFGHSLGRWLATLAVSLLLLALAYSHAPDPTTYLGFDSHSPSPLASSRPTPARLSHHHLAAGQAPVLASAGLSHPDRATGHQFSR
jgi:hypothetical protein